MGMTKKYSYLHGGVVYKYQTVSELFDKAYKENPYDLKHIYKAVTDFLDMIGYK
jgi:hypothetical protein